MASVLFIKTKPFATQPMKATPYSTGFDLFAIEDQVIEPGKTVKIGTGIRLKLDLHKTYARIASRSGLALSGIIAVGGVIDQDFESDIAVILLNTTDQPYTVKTSHRIAQLIFEQYRDDIVLEEAEDGAAGNGSHAGFGSTGA
jgi:dUTP pyrophosphatase